MSYPIFTNEQLKEFQVMSKKIKNPGATWNIKHGHSQKQFTAMAKDKEGKEIIFQIYQRKNSMMPETNFSCGISIILRGNKPLMLARYNSGHPSHRQKCHIHWTRTEELRKGQKPGKYVESVDRYTTINGALFCLIQDFNVEGLLAEPDHPQLFDKGIDKNAS